MRYRDYQGYAIGSIFEYFEHGGQGNPIVAMPTGTGKSIVIGGFIKEAYQRYPGQRIIKLTHVKELISQNMDKLMKLWPTAPAGIYSAGLKRREICPITYAGIATAIKVIKAFGRIDLVLIDEAHLVSPKAGTMYQKFVDGLKQVNPLVKVIGFTATHYRMGQGFLTEKDGLFTDICVDMTTVESFNWFISEGYLVRLVPKATRIELDVEGVSTQQGEYNLKQLQAAVDREEVTHQALVETLDQGHDRHHWLVFASGIEHAEHVSSMLDSLGVSSTFIHSKMSGGERDKRLAAYQAGEYRAMVNNGILTTGYDDPNIDLICMLRPTKSPGLWVQMLGRGTRPAYVSGYDLEASAQQRLASIATSHKQSCLVLDFAGNTRRLGPINDPVLPKRKGKKGGNAPVRICDNCGTYCHASLIECPECGYQFPRSVKIKAHAGTDALIANDMPLVETFKVDKVTYNKHTKEGRPDSIRASYYCGLRKFDEWICLEHGGFPRKRAKDWWRERASNEPPDTIKEAFQRLKELRTPEYIRVWINKKHPEIMSYEYASPEGSTPTH